MAGHLNGGFVYRDRIGGDDVGTQILDFYAERYPHSTRDTWRERIETGIVLADRKLAAPDAVLTAGQELAYHRPGWQEPEVPRHLAIGFEDGDVVAVVKPSGLPVLPGADYLENTLVTLMKQRYGGDALPPAPVHRLGRGTSGLILFARTAIARRLLSGDMATGRVHKRYRALVQGTTITDEFAIEQRIGQIPYPGLGYVYAATATGKASRSEVRVLERRTRETLVEVDIPTGRPHQIRIHLAAAGYPLVGEPLYQIGGKPRNPEKGERLPLPGDVGYHLHSTRVRFAHPRTRACVSVYAQPPEILRHRSAHLSVDET